MAIFHRHRFPSLWTPQRFPAEPVELARDHPLTNGLVGYWPLAGDGREYVAGNNAALTATTISGSQFGPTLQFNGSAQGLAARQLVIGSRFSVAGWVRVTGPSGGGYARVFNTAYGSAFYMGANGSGSGWLWIVNNSGASGATGGTYSTTTGWQHICGTYDGTTSFLYVNGVQVGSMAQTAPNTTSPLYIGHTNNLGEGGDNLTGQMSGWGYWNRCLSASEARQLYAAPFDMLRPVARRTYYVPPSGGPPVGALNLTQQDQTLSAAGLVYPTITGSTGAPLIPSPSCVLLVHADGAPGSTTFTDASPSAHTLTVTSTTNVTSTSKFGSGSVDFSGTLTTGIDTNNATDFNFGSGQFTIECWAYFTDVTHSGYLMSQFGTSGNHAWVFSAGNQFISFAASTDGSNVPNIVSAFYPSFVNNTWAHIAVDRDASGVVRVYVNGAVIGSATYTSAIYPSTLTAIVANSHVGSAGFTGYFDEVRVTKGRAMYAGAFTPPTQPFSVSNTVLLAHADTGPPLIDSSLSANTLTPTSVTVNATSKFGSGSVDFTAASTSAINTNNVTDFNFGAGQFTVEAWIYPTTGGSTTTILAQWSSGQASWRLGVVTGNSLRFYYSSTGSNTFSQTAAATLPLNTWTHVAVDRDASNVLRIYVNGVVLASPTVGTNLFASTTNCTIGNDAGGSVAFPGYIDEVRVSKGVARFGGAFTPPTAPYPPDFATGITQADQTLVASGTVGTGPSSVTGALNVTQANQTISATGTVGVSGTLSTTQANQTLAATAISGAGGALAVTQANQTLAATGQIVVGGALNVLQANQTLAATAVGGETGSLSLTQADQTLVAAGTLAVVGALSLTQTNQTLAASAIVASLPQTRVVIMA